MLINLFISLLFGLVQGVCEFLPISSTGHLIILEKLLNLSSNQFGLTFDVSLHLGTLIALIFYFRLDLSVLFTSFMQIIKSKKITTNNEKLVKLLIIGTIPAAVIGALFESKIETIFRSPRVVGMTLIIFSLVLIYVEKFGKKNKSIFNLNVKDSIITGLAQSIALIPGVSRSGITMACGLWQGLTREDAAKFTFLLSIPIIAGAGGKKLIDVLILIIGNNFPTNELLFYFTGMFAAAIFGYLTIKYFLKFINLHSLYPFIFYRIILGILIILFF